MATSFALNLSPFNFIVHTSSRHLVSQLSALYPDDVLTAVQNDEIYDFVVDYQRRPWPASASLAFRLGQQHFRFVEPAQIIPMFEWGLNWVVSGYQSRYLCIHAAVLEQNGQAVILPAPPGSGKSTLCAMMMLQGWRLLSDEHCMIDISTGDIVPCVRPVSLKNNSIEVLQQLYSKVTLVHHTLNTHKGTMAYLPASTESWRERHMAAKARLVIFPKYDAKTQGLQGNALCQSALFMQLAVNSFNYSVLGEVGFRTLTRLVSQVEAFQFQYNDGQLAIAQIEALLDEE